MNAGRAVLFVQRAARKLRELAYVFEADGFRAPDMTLLAVPFTPTHAEYVYLQGKRVLADQMEFLLAHFPRHSPLHKRLAGLI